MCVSYKLAIPWSRRFLSQWESLAVLKEHHWQTFMRKIPMESVDSGLFLVACWWYSTRWISYFKFLTVDFLKMFKKRENFLIHRTFNFCLSSPLHNLSSRYCPYFTEFRPPHFHPTPPSLLREGTMQFNFGGKLNFSRNKKKKGNNLAQSVKPIRLVFSVVCFERKKNGRKHIKPELKWIDFPFLLL